MNNITPLVASTEGSQKPQSRGDAHWIDVVRQVGSGGIGPAGITIILAMFTGASVWHAMIFGSILMPLMAWVLDFIWKLYVDEAKTIITQTEQHSVACRGFMLACKEKGGDYATEDCKDCTFWKECVSQNNEAIAKLQFIPLYKPTQLYTKTKNSFCMLSACVLVGLLHVCAFLVLPVLFYAKHHEIPLHKPVIELHMYIVDYETQKEERTRIQKQWIDFKVWLRQQTGDQLSLEAFTMKILEFLPPKSERTEGEKSQ